METIEPVTEQKELQNSTSLVLDIASSPVAAPTLSSEAVVSSLHSASAVTPTKDAVPLSVPTMQAPKTQAPQRLRRIPVVDPSTLIPARRSSTRSIKRKKFDDELVESSLVKTERGRSVKAGGPGSATSSPTLGLVPTAGTAVVHCGVNVTTPALSPAGDASTTLEASAGLITPSVITSTDSLSRSSLANSAGLIPVCVLQPTITTVSTVAVPAGTATAQVSSGASTSIVGQTVVAPVKSGKDITMKKDTEKHSDKGLMVKPPAEKRSRPSSGKSTTVSKGSSGTKVPSSRHVSSKSGGSKSSGSRSGVAKSKSRATIRSKSKRSKKQKTSTPAIKDLGRWKPQDDLILIIAVQQTNDLSAVHTGVKFSCRFTLKELEERWYALLYDPAISKIAMEAARQLHSDTVASIQGKALYSNAEEKLLGTLALGSQPSVDAFQSLLQQHPDVFHPARTAKTLQCHWLLMKQYHLLPDQTVQPMPRGDHILNLSDIEDFMNDDEIGEGEDDLVEQELTLVDRRNKREIRHLEQELPKWQVLVDSVTGISMPDFDSQTLGVLRGRLVRYLMRSREISLGRKTKDNHVDVDLSLEGPAWKVSRRQGIIKLRNSGDFFIANEGKRHIIVDGKPIMCGTKQKLNNNSVVEISCLRFTFLINQDVINSIRADSSKPSVSSSTAAT